MNSSKFENNVIQLYKARKKASFEIFLGQLNERLTEATCENENTTNEVLKAINNLNAKLTGIRWNNLKLCCKRISIMLFEWKSSRKLTNCNLDKKFFLEN